MSTTRPTLLLVDDDPMSVRTLHALLKDHYRVLFVASGAAAFDLVSREVPDLILLDVVMPGLDGYEVCRRLQARAETAGIPVIFLTGLGDEEAQTRAFEAGAVDFITKPVNPPVLLARVRAQLGLANQARALDNLVRERTAELERTEVALREAMHNLLTTEVTPGVFWVQVPEAGLYILCGCPGEIVKHLMRKGHIKTVTRAGQSYETGPNVILLSDVLIQNGGFANLAEFPVLQMLYRQGMILPGHPNNTGVRPLLIGSREQLDAQLEYIHRGNYGLLDEAELIESGVDAATADLMMRVKLKFAFGAIRSPAEFLDTLEVTATPREIRHGVTIQRIAMNRFRIGYRGEATEVDLSLPAGVAYLPPYPLGQHRQRQQYFAVLHTGEGDGWDINRPSMGALIMFQGRLYLIDAGPGILESLTALGIDISEIQGIFHTHAHDDHFAGLPALIRSDRRLEYYATPLVRASVTKKFAALLSVPEHMFQEFFVVHDLAFDAWNDCDGLEVMPLYSPHPVENNILMFRALDGAGYRTYAHWADLSSYGVLNGMVGTGPADLPAAFIDGIKRDYRRPADLKKLDIGGGLIHGMAEDFRDDPSSRLLLAHIARPLTLAEMAIGSESSFGAMDVLIPSQQDYRRQGAFRALVALFPTVPADQIHLLLNSPVVEINAGTIICTAGAQPESVDMILSGAVAFIEPRMGINNRLSFGSLIGFSELFGTDADLGGTYRALSHCSVLRLPAAVLREFMSHNELLDEFSHALEKVSFLRRTWLFGEQVSFHSRIKLSRLLAERRVQRESCVPVDTAIWLVRSGRIDILDPGNNRIESVGEGGFFGEASVLRREQDGWCYIAAEACECYAIPSAAALDLPIVHWKLLEVCARRMHASSRPSA